jgi:hypothetical protein
MRRRMHGAFRLRMSEGCGWQCWGMEGCCTKGESKVRAWGTVPHYGMSGALAWERAHWHRRGCWE